MWHITFAIIFFAFVAAGLAEPKAEGIIVTDGKGHAVAYATHFEKPYYPTELRIRRIGGKGTFQLHLRPDGTVQSVETLITTGHIELDRAAKSSFAKWRFRPGPTKVEVPIFFTPTN